MYDVCSLYANDAIQWRQKIKLSDKDGCNKNGICVCTNENANELQKMLSNVVANNAAEKNE